MGFLYICSRIYKIYTLITVATVVHNSKLHINISCIEHILYIYINYIYILYENNYYVFWTMNVDMSLVIFILTSYKILTSLTLIFANSRSQFNGYIQCRVNKFAACRQILKFRLQSPIHYKPKKKYYYCPENFELWVSEK